MVYIGEIVISRVKAATTIDDVRRIVDKYLASLKAVNHQGEVDRKYTRNILVALKYHKSVELNDHAYKNVVSAIEIIKKLHVHGTETPW